MATDWYFFRSTIGFLTIATWADQQVLIGEERVSRLERSTAVSPRENERTDQKLSWKIDQNPLDSTDIWGRRDLIAQVALEREPDCFTFARTVESGLFCVVC